MTDFSNLAKSRFSVLEYKKEPVEEGVILRILEAWLAAPTACNFQPQQYATAVRIAGRIFYRSSFM